MYDEISCYNWLDFCDREKRHEEWGKIMSEFSLEEFRKYNYKGARASIRFSTVLTGFFTEREKLSSGFTSFSIFFSRAAGGKLRKIPEFKDEIIESLEITEDGKRYLVKICLESEEIPEIQFFAVRKKGDARKRRALVHQPLLCKGNHFFEKMNPSGHFCEVRRSSVLAELHRLVPYV